MASPTTGRGSATDVNHRGGELRIRGGELRIRGGELRIRGGELRIRGIPVVSTAMAAKALGVSNQAARLGLEALAARGIVNELERISATTGRPTRWWAAEQLLDVIGRAR